MRVTHPQLINADLLYTSPMKLTVSLSEYLCNSGEVANGVANGVYKPVYDAGQVISDSTCTEAGNETG